MSADNVVVIAAFTDSIRVRGNQSASQFIDFEEAIGGDDTYFTVPQIQKLLWEEYRDAPVQPDRDTALLHAHDLLNEHYHEYGVWTLLVPFPCEDPGDIDMPDWYTDTEGEPDED